MSPPFNKPSPTSHWSASLVGGGHKRAANSRGKGKGEAGEESETYREEGWGEGYAVLQRILSGCNLFSFCAGV